MAEDLKNKYSDSERYRRGIDRILKSDQYTDEYKKVLMEKLGNDYNVPKAPVSADVEFDLLKEGGPVVTLSEDTGSLINLNDKPAAVSGYLEKPTYLEEELKKAVDIEVDELISPPPKQKPLTVPKDTYDDLRVQYNQSITDIEDLRDELNEKITELETAIADINLLNQTVDSEKLLRASAENETQASTERYTSVLGDFQTAMQKGIQEAIERVSLTAQVRGLQAQKEVLQQQLENLKSITESLQGQIEILQGNIELQQLQIEAQQNQIERQQEETAAIQVANILPGLGDKDNSSAWKIPDGSKGSQDTGAYPLYYKKHKSVWINGDKVEFYNLSEEPLIFTFTFEKGAREKIKGDGLNSPFMSGPARIEVPPRQESEPGKETVTFTKVKIYREKGGNFLSNPSAYAIDNIKVQVSNGTQWNIGAYYKIDK